MAGVNHDRQVCFSLQYRHGCQVKRVAREALAFAYGQHAALTKNDVLVAFDGDIFREGKKFLDTAPKFA
jgi:hypothetical protein